MGLLQSRPKPELERIRLCRPNAKRTHLSCDTPQTIRMDPPIFVNACPLVYVHNAFAESDLLDSSCPLDVLQSREIVQSRLAKEVAPVAPLGDATAHLLESSSSPAKFELVLVFYSPIDSHRKPYSLVSSCCYYRETEAEFQAIC